MKNAADQNMDAKDTVITGEDTTRWVMEKKVDAAVVVITDGESSGRKKRSSMSWKTTKKNWRRNYKQWKKR